VAWEKRVTKYIFIFYFINDLQLYQGAVLACPLNGHKKVEENEHIKKNQERGKKKGLDISFSL
jgi:hypothetical protein